MRPTRADLVLFLQNPSLTFATQDGAAEVLYTWPCLPTGLWQWVASASPAASHFNYSLPGVRMEARSQCILDERNQPQAPHHLTCQQKKTPQPPLQTHPFSESHLGSQCHH